MEKPLNQYFEKYNQDFYKIDGSLFSPASVILNSKESGKFIILERLIKK